MKIIILTFWIIHALGNLNSQNGTITSANQDDWYHVEGSGRKCIANISRRFVIRTTAKKYLEVDIGAGRTSTKIKKALDLRCGDTRVFCCLSLKYF
ncbi:MAG: hypothetical protein IJ685_14425 [Selenomonadaceae bacterium]|nr:hypothetical protein [Selenomonadaceae bacterium]